MPDEQPVTVFACEACGTLDPGPREFCVACGSPDLRVRTVSGEGHLVSWTTIRRAPTRFRGQEPYAVAVVDLAAGVRLTGRLLGETDGLRVGAPVTAVAQENGAYVFEQERT